MEKEQNSSNPMAQMADDIQERIKMVEESKDIDEETKNSISHKLFKHLYESITNLFDQEDVQEHYVNVAKPIGTDAATSLMAIITTISVGAAYDAIVFYNDVVAKSYDDMIGQVVKCISETNAETAAVKDAVAVLRKRIEEISTELTVNKIHP